MFDVWDSFFLFLLLHLVKLFIFARLAGPANSMFIRFRLMWALEREYVNPPTHLLYKFRGVKPGIN